MITPQVKSDRASSSSSEYIKIHAIFDEFSDQCTFLVVYIKEAHPEDEWMSRANYRDTVVYNQPTTYEDRRNIANDFLRDMAFRIPTVIDKMDDAVGTCYGPWPERVYLINQDGKLAYVGDPVPYGFDTKGFRAFMLDRYHEVPGFLDRARATWDHLWQ